MTGNLNRESVAYLNKMDTSKCIDDWWDLLSAAEQRQVNQHAAKFESELKCSASTQKSVIFNISQNPHFSKSYPNMSTPCFTAQSSARLWLPAKKRWMTAVEKAICTSMCMCDMERAEEHVGVSVLSYWVLVVSICEATCMMFPVVKRFADACGLPTVPVGSHMQLGNTFHVGLQALLMVAAYLNVRKSSGPVPDAGPSAEPKKKKEAKPEAKKKKKLPLGLTSQGKKKRFHAIPVFGVDLQADFSWEEYGSMEAAQEAAEGWIAECAAKFEVLHLLTKAELQARCLDLCLLSPSPAYIHSHFYKSVVLCHEHRQQ